ncbi:unnamed protein product [Cyprideis torosa]|uniref:Uncharacterized protein n=1 Tax=Cyprideis torosa TaxID=163714 RepID=A0A7R8WI16_9CRUS|nr:unnamed protein product [Cyprideis torosa]CAG0893947.1 unnamed protein product [Cyprideis torosa]
MATLWGVFCKHLRQIKPRIPTPRYFRLDPIQAPTNIQSIFQCSCNEYMYQRCAGLMPLSFYPNPQRFTIRRTYFSQFPRYVTPPRIYYPPSYRTYRRSRSGYNVGFSKYLALAFLPFQMDDQKISDQTEDKPELKDAYNAISEIIDMMLDEAAENANLRKALVHWLDNEDAEDTNSNAEELSAFKEKYRVRVFDILSNTKFSPADLNKIQEFIKTTLVKPNEREAESVSNTFEDQEPLAYTQQVSEETAVPIEDSKLPLKTYPTAGSPNQNPALLPNKQNTALSNQNSIPLVLAVQGGSGPVLYPVGSVPRDLVQQTLPKPAPQQGPTEKRNHVAQTDLKEGQESRVGAPKETQKDIRAGAGESVIANAATTPSHEKKESKEQREKTEASSASSESTPDSVTPPTTEPPDAEGSQQNSPNEIVISVVQGSKQEEKEDKTMQAKEQRPSSGNTPAVEAYVAKTSTDSAPSNVAAKENPPAAGKIVAEELLKKLLEGAMSAGAQVNPSEAPSSSTKEESDTGDGQQDSEQTHRGGSEKDDTTDHQKRTPSDTEVVQLPSSEEPTKPALPDQEPTQSSSKDEPSNVRGDSRDLIPEPLSRGHPMTLVPMEVRISGGADVSSVINHTEALHPPILPDTNVPRPQDNRSPSVQNVGNDEPGTPLIQEHKDNPIQATTPPVKQPDSSFAATPPARQQMIRTNPPLLVHKPRQEFLTPSATECPVPFPVRQIQKPVRNHYDPSEDYGAPIVVTEHSFEGTGKSGSSSVVVILAGDNASSTKKDPKQIQDAEIQQVSQASPPQVSQPQAPAPKVPQTPPPQVPQAPPPQGPKPPPQERTSAGNDTAPHGQTGSDPKEEQPLKPQPVAHRPEDPEKTKEVMSHLVTDAESDAKEKINEAVFAATKAVLIKNLAALAYEEAAKEKAAETGLKQQNEHKQKMAAPTTVQQTPSKRKESPRPGKTP